jgi:uncharacterized protein (TIGR02145 family)
MKMNSIRMMTFLVILFVLQLLTTLVFAQAPQKMSYQAVVRDASGSLIRNKQAGMRISILKGPLPGTVVFQQIQTLTTNDNGLVTMEIGGAGTGFDAIDWGNGTYFIKTEVDPAGGTSYIISGTSQLLSVPYALYAKNSETAKEAATGSYLDEKLKLMTAVFHGVQDADGNHYNAVMLGDQVWMVENLKTTKYNDGTAIPFVTDQTAWANLTTPGYCWYNNDAANKSIYGAMYNGYTMQTGKLCPAGWHVPASSEFLTLKNYLIANGYNYDGTTTSNKIAKSMAATTNWTSSGNAGSPGNTPAANNNSGFSGRPGGIRAYSGTFYYVGTQGFWMSSTTYSTSASFVSLENISAALIDLSGPIKSGVSVRCLKD